MADSGEARGSPTGSVLILHASRDRGQALARMLRMAGHTVTVVGEGPEAATAVAMATPDVVVASPSFEDPPLADLVRGIRWNLGLDLPVLLVAGREDAGLLPSADDIVREPVDPHEMSVR